MNSTLLDSNGQSWSELNNNNKNHKAHKEAGKYGPNDGKNNSTESSLEKDMTDTQPKF